MAASPDNSCLPQPTDAKADADSKARPKTTRPAPEDTTSAEALLEDYNHLQERMQRTTNALASAAHDLKTPLAILNGYIELLRSGKLGALNERQSDVLDDMYASGQRLQAFIQDFLSYSLLETGELRMQFEAGDLNACLSEVCHLWSQRFQDKGLALYFLANDKLAVFPFDSAKVQRVVSNLLENASKFTPPGGTVWLHAEPYMWERRTVANPGGEPSLEKERRRQQVAAPNAVKVSVADTGPGIPPEYHLEVFDDFFRLPCDENHSDGMGLGLAIARRLVHGMDGKIWVESEPRAGSKFCFLLPLKPAPTGSARGKHK